jgi:osmotically-inducible protein OsmY
MTSKLNHVLLGMALLVLSGYSAAGTSNEQINDELRGPGDRDGSHSTDREIGAEVMRRLNEKLTLGIGNIQVRSFDHNVYLSGAVGSSREVEEAEAIARAVPGVRKVYNGLGWFGA